MATKPLSAVRLGMEVNNITLAHFTTESVTQFLHHVADLVENRVVRSAGDSPGSLRQPFTNASFTSSGLRPLPRVPRKPSFGATILQAFCIEIFSARMRASTRRTTRSFAS